MAFSTLPFLNLITKLGSEKSGYVFRPVLCSSHSARAVAHEYTTETKLWSTFMVSWTGEDPSSKWYVWVWTFTAHNKRRQKISHQKGFFNPRKSARKSHVEANCLGKVINLLFTLHFKFPLRNNSTQETDLIVWHILWMSFSIKTNISLTPMWTVSVFQF